MSKLNDLTGNVYGRLVVVERAPDDRHGNRQWLCRCRCGTNAVVMGASLTEGETRSCGCLKAEVRNRNYMRRTFTPWPSRLKGRR